MLDTTFITNHLEYVKREIELIMKEQSTIEDWLWNDLNGVLSSNDSQDMIDFLEDYYESSMVYIGLDLNNLKERLLNRKIYQPIDEDLQAEYGSFVVWLDKETVMDEFCLNENEVLECSILDIEEPTYMLKGDEELVEWAKSNLRNNEYECFCIGSVILKVKLCNNEVSLIEYDTSDYQEVYSNFISSCSTDTFVC